MTTLQKITISHDIEITKQEILDAMPTKLRSWVNNQFHNGNMSYLEHVAERGKEIIIDRSWDDVAYETYRTVYKDDIKKAHEKVKSLGCKIEEEIDIKSIGSI